MNEKAYLSSVLGLEGGDEGLKCLFERCYFRGLMRDHSVEGLVLRDNRRNLHFQRLRIGHRSKVGDYCGSRGVVGD